MYRGGPKLQFELFLLRYSHFLSLCNIYHSLLLGIIITHSGPLRSSVQLIYTSGYAHLVIRPIMAVHSLAIMAVHSLAIMAVHSLVIRPYTHWSTMIESFLGPLDLLPWRVVGRSVGRSVCLSVCLSTPVTRQPMFGFFSKLVRIFLGRI